MVLNALDIAVSHGNKYRKKLIMKRNTNLSLFIGNIIVYVENPKRFYRKTIKINGEVKDPGYE